MVPAFGFVNQLSLTENISEFEVSYILVFILLYAVVYPLLHHRLGCTGLNLPPFLVFCLAQSLVLSGLHRL